MTSAISNAALFAAAKSGDVTALQQAIANGADVNYQDDSGWTALMWAAHFHHLDAVAALFDLGADGALRDGLNQDAGDKSCSNYSKDSDRSFSVLRFIHKHPSYVQSREGLTTRADVLAKRLAKKFSGRKKRQGVVYVNSEFEVTAKYRGMQCRFRVFAGGFDLWIQNFRAGPMAISLNLERTDNATYPLQAQGWEAWSDGSLEIPLYVCAETASEAALRNIPGDPQVRECLHSLALGRFEWLVAVPGQLRFRCLTEDMEVIGSRMDAIALVFERTNRPEAAPLLPAMSLKYGKANPARLHRFGGSTATGIPCPSCGENLCRLASFSLSDVRLSGLAWSSGELEAACCFACALPETSSLTVVSYDSEPKVSYQSDVMGLADAEPFGERCFALEPLEKAQRRISRAGGAPSWIQTDETPDCPRCSTPMRFLAQFMSTDALMFGADMGAAYVFVCQPCRTVATAIQSH